MRFLYGRIDYERTPAGPDPNTRFKLGRMRELLDRLGGLDDRLPIVHVAGTKGKGSTVAMIAVILSAAGYRTGTFTSPHLDRIEQRIMLDGRPCSAAELVELVARLRPAVEAMDRRASSGDDPTGGGPTYFEITTAMALLHFAQNKVDAAVLEVGLGGRLDSTNVCHPCVSVITSISFDHTRQLGDTLAEIAREKAGIVKPGVPVVSGVLHGGVLRDEPREVIREICRVRDCRLRELGVDFDFHYRPPQRLDLAPATAKLDFHMPEPGRSGGYRDVALGLVGRHQAANAAVALATLDELRHCGWRISERAIRTGLAEVRCPARVEVLARRPTVVIDAAHNRASIDALVEVLAESFAPRRRLLIFAATREKDIRGMLDRLLGEFDEVVFTRYQDNPRAVDPEELSELATELTSRRYPVHAEPAAAWRHVRRQAAPEDLVCVTGSFFIAAEIRRLIDALHGNEGNVTGTSKG